MSFCNCARFFDVGRSSGQADFNARRRLFGLFDEGSCWPSASPERRTDKKQQEDRCTRTEPLITVIIICLPSTFSDLSNFARIYTRILSLCDHACVYKSRFRDTFPIAESTHIAIGLVSQAQSKCVSGRRRRPNYDEIK